MSGETSASAAPLTKNQRRRLKKRAEKKQAALVSSDVPAQQDKVEVASPANGTPSDVEVEYVSLDMSKELALPEDDPAYEEFMRIFNKFSSAEDLCGQTDEEVVPVVCYCWFKGVVVTGVSYYLQESNGAKKDGETHGDGEGGDREDGNDADAEEEKVLSKKQRKKLKRLSVAELKQLVSCPDVVEAHDVTAADPKLLVFLKSYRNTVPVPRHWSHKRKYLQGKRGIEKQAFMLPGTPRAIAIWIDRS